MLPVCGAVAITLPLGAASALDPGYAVGVSTATAHSGALRTADKPGPSLAKPVITAPGDGATAMVEKKGGDIAFVGTGEPGATMTLYYRRLGTAWHKLDGFTATVGTDGHWRAPAHFAGGRLTKGSYDFHIRQTVGAHVRDSRSVRLSVGVWDRSLRWDASVTDRRVTPSGTMTLAGWTEDGGAGPVEVLLKAGGATYRLGRFTLDEDGERTSFKAEDVAVPGDAAPGPATLQLVDPEEPGNHADLSITVRKPLTEGLRTLGYANRFGTADTEFRYDGVVTVPKDVTIKRIRYSYNGNDTLNMVAVKRPRGRVGIDQEYEIVDTSSDGVHDVITFHLRGDLGLATNVCPKGGMEYPTKTEITLSNGKVLTTAPMVDVVNSVRCDGDPEGTGRPYVRLPWDANWGGTPPGYSQNGFGYLADDGSVPGNTFPIDLVNPRQGLPDVPCNNSDHVYYQFVREDGTPSRLTPEPVRMDVLAHLNPGQVNRNFLGPVDFKKAGDKPGYYKLLVWPQADSSDGGTCNASWDPHNPADAAQLGSVFYAYKGIADDDDDPAPAER